MNLSEIVQSLADEPVTLHGGVSGGSINDAVRGTTASGRPLFIKSNRRSIAGMFAAEAAGLAALRAAPGGCRIPEVIGVHESALVLEWIEAGPETAQSQAELGRGLAAQHRVTRPECGFDAGDNFIGSTAQFNPNEADWITFFRDHRLGFQKRLLQDNGRGSDALLLALDRLSERLDDLLRVDDEAHALLHGDLWGGNKMTDSAGAPVLIDPAVYFGCREADVAMTQLFGGFSPRFYSAYNEAFPPAPGYSERRDIYNLYHVLNHANLFGGGYAAQALSIAQRYV